MKHLWEAIRTKPNRTGTGGHCEMPFEGYVRGLFYWKWTGTQVRDQGKG